MNYYSKLIQTLFLLFISYSSNTLFSMEPSPSHQTPTNKDEINKKQISIVICRTREGTLSTCPTTNPRNNNENPKSKRRSSLKKIKK